jgi:hypothetical protein
MATTANGYVARKGTFHSTERFTNAASPFCQADNFSALIGLVTTAFEGIQFIATNDPHFASDIQIMTIHMLNCGHS